MIDSSQYHKTTGYFLLFLVITLVQTNVAQKHNVNYNRMLKKGKGYLTAAPSPVPFPAPSPKPSPIANLNPSPWEEEEDVITPETEEALGETDDTPESEGASGTPESEGASGETNVPAPSPSVGSDPGGSSGMTINYANMICSIIFSF